METVASARLRLLVARGEFEAGRELAAALDAVAVERDLVRTRMRGLALAVVLEHRAGEDGRAKAHLVTWLRLYEDSDYAWPLARERGVALPLLDAIAGGGEGDGAVRGAAAALGEAMRENGNGGEASAHWPLNGREMEVLALLEGHSDREIAQALSLSYEGVRSRVRRIFEKLGARGRLDAVHRARARGFLPPEGDGPRAKP